MYKTKSITCVLMIGQIEIRKFDTFLLNYVSNTILGKWNKCYDCPQLYCNQKFWHGIQKPIQIIECLKSQLIESNSSKNNEVLNHANEVIITIIITKHVHNQ